MYPYSSTIMTDSAEVTIGNGLNDAVETQVQSILSELEQLPADVQLAVYTRLLSGLTAKLTSTVVKNAISAAKVDQQAIKPKAVAKKQATSRNSAKDDIPRADSLLRQLNDSADPVEAWYRFGENAAQLLDVLREEPTGTLQTMLDHRNMPSGPKPRGKSREKLAEAIALRLEQYFRGS